MVQHPRQQKLLDFVREHRFASIDELASALEASPQTIRRDIRWLADHNLLRRYHGGAGQRSSTENLSYDQRQTLNVDGKRRIARQVAAQVEPGSSLILNIGTTTEEVARALANHQGLSVVTNNLNVAAILSGNPANEVIIAGGLVRARDRGIVGEATIDFIRQFKVDIGIIGVSSIEPDGTLRDYDFREVKVAQTIIAQSRTVWLVADHGKFSRQALVRLGDLSQIDALFTDAEPPVELAPALAEAKTQVFVAAG